MSKILIDQATVQLVLAKIKCARECQFKAIDPVLSEAEEILESALAEQPAQQEPVAYWVPKAEQFCIADSSGRPFAKAWEPLYTTPQPTQQEPVAGEGKEFSERLKLCARNVAFVAAGRVDMSSAAMQEMFALIDHVCVGIDSPQPAQRKPLDAGEISRLWKQHTNEDGPHHNPYDDDGLGFARATKAAHGIKENT